MSIHIFEPLSTRCKGIFDYVYLKDHVDNVIPFIIEDAKKNYYYRGLAEWRNEKGWLTGICLDGQDTFIRLLNMLEIEY